MTRQKQLWVPADRFLAALTSYRPHHESAPYRLLSELRSGRKQFVKLETADAVFIDAGVEYLWHVEAVEGGFADIYEDGVQYGSPVRAVRVDPAPGSTLRRYADEASRYEALRRNWRESKRRARDRKQEEAA